MNGLALSSRWNCLSVSWSNLFLLHSSRFPDNILNYMKRSSLVRTLSHIKASLPLHRGRVPEDSSQQRADRANPSKSWAMMTYSFFSFFLLVQKVCLFSGLIGQVDPKPSKSHLPDQKYNFNSFSWSRTSVDKNWWKSTLYLYVIYDWKLRDQHVVIWSGLAHDLVSSLMVSPNPFLWLPVNHRPALLSLFT